MVLAQVLQPGHALHLVGAQRDAQALGCANVLRAARATQAQRQALQAVIALQLPRAMRANALGLVVKYVITQALAQRIDPKHIPRREHQGTLFATGVGQQIQHGADDFFQRQRRCVNALAARCAQGDDRVVFNRVHLVRIEPAAIALEQLSQQRGQVQHLAFHLHAQADQP